MVRFLSDSEIRHRLLKYGRVILLLINACLLMGGVMLIGCSVWVLDEARGFVMNSFYSTAAILLTLSGLFCILLGMIGCVGSQERARVSLLIFICGLSGVFLLLITTQVLAFLFASGLSTSFREWIYASATLYFSSTFVQDSWDVLQSRLKCCGITKVAPTGTTTETTTAATVTQEPFSVWQTNPEFRKENGPAVPESCCVSDLISSFQNYRQFRFQCQGQKAIIHRADCYDRIQEFVKPKIQLAAFASLSMTVFLSLAIVSALVVYRGMRAEMRKRRQTDRKHDTARAAVVQQVRQRPISVSTLAENLNNDMLLGGSASPPLADESWRLVTHRQDSEEDARRDDMKSQRAGLHQQTNERTHPGSYQQQAVAVQSIQRTNASANQHQVEPNALVPRTAVQKVRNMYADMQAQYKQEFSITRAGNEFGRDGRRR